MSNRGYRHKATRTKRVKSEVMRLCAALQGRRLSLGLTQQELAEEADISTATLARYETGHRVPSLPMLVHLASVLRLDIALTPK